MLTIGTGHLGDAVWATPFGRRRLGDAVWATGRLGDGPFGRQANWAMGHLGDAVWAPGHLGDEFWALVHLGDARFQRRNILNKVLYFLIFHF